MPELTKLATQHNDLTSAYDERTRLFNRLRDLKMDDDTRKQVAADYAETTKRFDKLRAEALK